MYRGSNPHHSGPPPTPGVGAAHPSTAITAPTPVGPARGVQGQGAIYASMQLYVINTV